MIEVPPDYDRKVQEHLETMEVMSRANAVPLPGSLADAFKIAPAIEVGPYKVRPFYDADFEFLQELNHPLFEMMLASQNGKPVDVSSAPKRSTVWELCYIFTHDVDDIDGLFAEGSNGIIKLRASAKRQFSRLQGNAIMALQNAIGEQLKAYWSPGIGYEAAPAEEGEATSKRNFTPVTLEKPLMDSAG